MKKIAVLTDFSERSANAARYAWALACRLQADILLYNVYLVPSAEPMSAQIAWPMEEAGEVKAGAEAALEKAAAQLKDDLHHSQVSFNPRVEYRAQEGVYSARVDTLLGDRDVILLVMGNHHQGFSSLLLGNHTREVLDNTNLPVLIIPETAGFHGIKRIAFATDLNVDDLQVIHSLANLARPFNAEILLTHLCERTTDQERRIADFLHEVTNKINYPNIYYREITDAHTNQGLQAMAETVQADLMVMVHRRKNFVERLFGASHSQKLAAESKVPLLIFPYPVETLPVF